MPTTKEQERSSDQVVDVDVGFDCDAITQHLKHIIYRNQSLGFLQELLTMTVILEQEFYK